MSLAARPVRVPSDDELQSTVALVEQITTSLLVVARVALDELARVRRVRAGLPADEA
jgi:hypothetical protein